MRYLFKSHNLIGDALYVGPALRAWFKKNGLYFRHETVGGLTVETQHDEVYIQTLPDHVAPLYQGMVRDLFEVITVFERPEGTFDFEHVFDVSAAFAICDKEKCHVSQGYAKLLGVDIDSVKPIYIPDDDKWTEGPHQTLGSLKGCILISMFSASCESRDKNNHGLPPNKMLPFDKWKPLLSLLRESYPDVPIRFLGAPSDMDTVNKESLYAKDIIRPGECMFGIPLNRLALIMQKARLLVTIDNGMAHLAASQETPTFEMYPRVLGPHYIVPFGNPNLEWVHMDPVHVSPAQLVFRLKHAIKRFKEK
jgi:hypothetical protein